MRETGPTVEPSSAPASAENVASDQESNLDTLSDSGSVVFKRPRKRRAGKLIMVARRAHLYLGLFLLPWVMLYGVTGPMFTHQGLFPDVEINPVPASIVSSTPMAEFPSPEQLADQIVVALREQSDAEIRLNENHEAAFTNWPMFVTNHQGKNHVVRLNPLVQQAEIVSRDQKPPAKRLIPAVKSIKLDRAPSSLARQSASMILPQVGIEHTGELKMHGWTKLNFLAEVDGEPARITYVLNDGHVDVTRLEGTGMNMREFMMRLHTVHGQSPHWNARFFWTLLADLMGIAMVSWAITGLVMWWQIKRTRRWGAVVIGGSLLTAVTLYFSMQYFYTTTML
ncbi:hypothetical protein Pla22_25310 [Rubripirellula amarantea]|uniref:PepSY-associated TM helix n=1 Tax=Rubripirellula amarantea TaxID=2527999 RepID=A0A5C5WVW5_9BACT|nr:PepSY domain-containing protein [Rubripirellula amarantea]TWT54877.1 hypothetical protein Pla22_25310 [Rubripirellula amarantea]